MDWKYRIKRLFANRFGISAALFLLVLVLGAFSAVFGVLRDASACAGFKRPEFSKQDPSLPRATAPLPVRTAATLNAPAPVDSWPDRLSQQAAAAETAVQNALTNQHFLIHLYGGYQRLTGRTVIEDSADPTYSVVRLDNGLLNFSTDDVTDPEAQAATLKRLGHALDQRGISLLYLQAPGKPEPGREGLPYGVDDTANQNADDLLAALEQGGVDFIDFRQTLRDAGGDWADWFYTTDHHWNQEGAFTAFQALCDKLEDYDQTVPVSRGTKRRAISIDPKWTDRDSYRVTTLPNLFLGSQGKRVGSLYAGQDDFALWVPKLPTLLRYDATNPPSHGDAEDTVLFPQRLEEEDPFIANPYTYYAGGDYGVSRIKNYYNPTGPRILLVRDSFACALTPYLAYVASEVITVDPRYFSGDFLSYVDWTTPDVVLVMYAPGTLRSADSFSFLAQSAAPSKGDALRWKED